jgi:uncharacterized repeat protein (TIGR01451 family)
VVARADLAIIKTSDQSTYKPSSLITYTLSVTNNGPSDAQAVVITDNLPDGQQALYVSDMGGCTKSGDALTCTVGAFAVDESRSLNVNVLNATTLLPFAHGTITLLKYQSSAVARGSDVRKTE